ncbi:hypothetical protein [Vibrio agarivorans]|uniref:hypothetical protein n=1 Tax=Vibrio agarivorans TaxID=153622 RepID=UPI00222EA2FB|nr:hypothetical protein [Vibrio agarivorans]
MSKYDVTNIEYRGETNGVHSWSSPSGQPYYWHPDWLHIAEDAAGSHPKQPLDVKDGHQPTKEHAISAILAHLNDWASEKLSEHPDIETDAHEQEFNLKK